MPTQKKIDTVTQLADRVNRAKALFLADYRGLKHKQFEELRKVLKTVGAEFTVVKNRLMIRALGDRAKSFTDALNEPTAILFAYDDVVAPLTKLIAFFKTAGSGKTKTGLMGETLLSESDVERLAHLPGRMDLLAQLVRQLNAPISGLHNALSWNLRKLVYVLQAVSKTKTN